jgi:hypothetical protein
MGFLVGLLLLGGAAWGSQPIALLPVNVYGNVAVASAVFFDADACSQVNGWFWVRPECRQYVDSVFTGIDTRTVSPEDPYVYVNVGALVTNGVDGGSGWDTQVGIEVWVVQRLEDVLGLAEPVGKKLLDRSSVTLQNHFLPRMEADTQGVGYQAWADASRVSAEDLAKYGAVNGQLIVVRVIRLGAAKNQPEHIAVNQSSVTLSYRIVR